MSWPDDSDLIYFDGFLDNEATIGEDTVRAVVSDSWQTTKGGSSISPTIGEHSKILLRKSEVSSIGDRAEIVIGSKTYTVRDVLDSGSCWLCICTSNQRRSR